MPELVTVQHVANLAIGAEGEGRIRSTLQTEAGIQVFGSQLAEHTKPLTNVHTVVCMDDRPAIEIGDGTRDPEALALQVLPQWAGGLVLATTKALVAANVAYLAGAKNFKDAYLMSYELLTSLGYQDGGHAKCGASALVEASVAQPVEAKIALPTTAAVIGVDSTREQSYEAISLHKKRKLEEGYFSGWTSGWHEDFLSQKAPQNFSILKTADDAVHGHYADGFKISLGNNGLAKNALYDATGKMAFGVTPAIILDLSNKLGGTEQERRDIATAFALDLLDVSDKLVAPGLPAFADAA